MLGVITTHYATIQMLHCLLKTTSTTEISLTHSFLPMKSAQILSAPSHASRLSVIHYLSPLSHLLRCCVSRNTAPKFYR